MAHEKTSARADVPAAPRDWVRANGGVIAVVAAIIAVCGLLAAMIDNGFGQLGARIASVEAGQRETNAAVRDVNAAVRDVNAAVRDLNTRVGRIEGRLGLAPADGTEP